MKGQGFPGILNFGYHLVNLQKWFEFIVSFMDSIDTDYIL